MLEFKFFMAKHHPQKRTELVSCWITEDEKKLLKLATPKNMSESEFASTILMNYVKKILIERKSKQTFKEQTEKRKPRGVKIKKTDYNGEYPLDSE